MPVPYHAGEGADQVLELTRASAVGPDGSVIYDKLVRGGRGIVNSHLSQFIRLRLTLKFLFFFFKAAF